MGDEKMSLARAEGEKWVAWQGDCVELMKGMTEGSIDLTVTSIPFANLLTYSASAHDVGNCVNHEEFFENFAYVAREWLRVTKPGRIVACHCMQLPSLKQRDGYIGLIDFRGKVIKAFQDVGFIYTSEVVIWKSPVVAAQRSKALGLLYKTLRRDSTMSRMGIPDYVCFFRKPGVNPEPVEHDYDDFPLTQWQEWASPVWMDIDQGETLQARSVREHDDEAHLAPLQTQVIERCLTLYSNPNDVVFDPFGGIGSTGVMALKMGRRSVACELKESYFTQMVANMKRAEIESAQPDLFSLAGAP